jgi:hypothetical protein
MLLPPRRRQSMPPPDERVYRRYLNAVHEERLRLLEERVANRDRLTRILGIGINLNFGWYPEEILPVLAAIQERLVGASRRRVRRVCRLLYQRDRIRQAELQRQNTDTYMIWASRDTPALPLPFITTMGRQDEELMRGDRIFLHIQ